MKHFIIALTLISLLACQHEKNKDITKDSWISIWNGEDLTGWHKYLGTPYNMKTDSLGKSILPFGIDNDPLEVISIVEDKDSNAIRITGLAWGMIYTDKEYKNYHLKLKIKWGEDKHAPREQLPRDSGLLYHGFGEPGSGDNVWMNSQELQIQEGDMGDYWPVGDVEIDIPSVPTEDKFYIFKEGAELRKYYNADILDTAEMDSLAKRRVLKAFNAEKPHGQWNDVELIVFGDSSIHIVNEKVVMRLYNSRGATNNLPLHVGKIILQSEGAEVFYKDLYIKPINEIPEKYN